MHIGGFVRGKGQFVITEYVPTDEKTGPRFPLLLTTGRILSQYNVGRANAPHRKRGMACGGLARNPSARRRAARHPRGQLGEACEPRRARRALRATITDRVAPGVVYTTFHHPDTQANVVTTDYSDWATNCPEYKVTAVQVSPSNGPREWQEGYARAVGAQPADRSAGGCGVMGSWPPPFVEADAACVARRRAGAHAPGYPRGDACRADLRRLVLRGHDGDAQRPGGFRHRFRADRGCYRRALAISKAWRSWKPGAGSRPACG